MTEILAGFLNGLIKFLTALLPMWKKLTVRARLYDRLQPSQKIKVGEKNLELFIPNRTCIYWAKEGPNSEPMTNTWISSFSEGDVFADVGANIGLYSLLAAAHGASKVYAIEPNPFSYSVLARNIGLNRFDSIVVPLCLAMNDSSSLVTFKLGSSHAGSVGNEIIGEGSDSDSMSITTASFSLDELVRIQGISKVTHLKIDVDGLELDILRGAKEVLSNSSLKSLLIEDDTEKEGGESELAAFIEHFGFRQSHEWGRDGTINKIFSR